MQTAYHPDFPVPVAYEFTAMPEDPDAQVEQTVSLLGRNILEDSANPLIIDDAERAARSGGPIAGVWRYIKGHMDFVNDQKIASRLRTDDPRRESVVETIIRPIDQSLLIRMRGKGFEDCDGFTGYGACLLTALGIPVQLVTAAADPDKPREYSHIYIAAYPDGIRMPLDFSHGEYPGWECPNLGRIREWPLNQMMSSLWVPLAMIGALSYFLFRRRAS